ncbi:hypothetical protein BDQ17DRAFT_1172193, partial [Cyathus striatus]
LFAYMANWMLYGVLCVQVYLYYLAFPKDPLHNKIMVYIVFILETIQSAMIGRDVYVTFAKGFGNPDAINNIHLEWFTLPFLGSIVAGMVQILYAYRIHILSKSWIVS